MLKAVDAGLYQKNDKNDIVQVKITEGINHQVKLMLGSGNASDMA